ncbi:NlpC/P60 family protein [Pontibacter diazotrophicus]|uniref:NlpC/P60 family protein n=1 Tax=Pontibacter diazotrophicus TaxID=1400979 RepID=A0A3D8LIM7_9BACT|nr:NlpC/P60 family protein [Pontibacter diazotrophicus]
MASCQSTKPTFSKRGETYKSAREIAAEKRLAKKGGRTRTGGNTVASSKDRTSRTRTRNLDKDVATVIQAARSYTGTPYKWGGTTRIGMDCSGLLCTSFQTIDVALPRTSNEQSRYGKKVKPKNIKEGDLVFFGANRFSRDITHVGMVTEVISKKEVRFIHASSSVGVIETNLYADHFQKIFIKAVRPPVF